jgi:hypothetical protein
MLDLELPTAKLDEIKTKKNLGMKETHLGVCRGGRSDGEGDRAALLRQRAVLQYLRCDCTRCERGGAEEVWGEAVSWAPFIGPRREGKGVHKAMGSRSVASGH